MMNASIPDILHIFNTSVFGILSCRVILHVTHRAHVKLIEITYMTTIVDLRATHSHTQPG